MPEVTKKAVDAIKAFCLSGPDFAMTHYNKQVSGLFCHSRPQRDLRRQ